MNGYFKNRTGPNVFGAQEEDGERNEGKANVVQKFPYEPPRTTLLILKDPTIVITLTSHEGIFFYFDSFRFILISLFSSFFSLCILGKRIANLFLWCGGNFLEKYVFIATENLPYPMKLFRSLYIFFVCLFIDLKLEA